MPDFKTIPAPRPGLHIQYRARVSAICSEGGAPFSGELTVYYQTSDQMLEYESFETWLREISVDEETIESLAVRIHTALRGALGEALGGIDLAIETQVHGPVVVSVVDDA